MKKCSFWKRKNGNITIMALLAFSAVLVMSGLVIDIGFSYTQASELQTAADASALAAASILPISVNDSSKTSAVLARVREYALKNGVDSASVESVSLAGVVSGQYTTVQVSLSRPVNYLFGSIAGIDGTVIHKKATAAVESVTSSTSMVPLGIDSASLGNAMAANGAQEVIVKYGAGDSTTGWFGALDLDGVKGGGAKDYATWLAYGYDGTIKTGDILYMEDGNMAGPTQTAFAARYSKCTHFAGLGGCTTAHFDKNCPRVVYLIVYQVISNDSLKVIGFSPFVLDYCTTDSEIYASHLNVYENDGESVPVNESNINFGLFRCRLIE